MKRNYLTSLFLIILILFSSSCKSQDKIAWDAAWDLYNSGLYIEAAEAFEALGSYSPDKKSAINASFYANQAREVFAREEENDTNKGKELEVLLLLEQHEYDQAEALIETISSPTIAYNLREMLRKSRLHESSYEAALSAMEEGDYEVALRNFELIGDFKDASTLAGYVREMIAAIEGLRSSPQAIKDFSPDNPEPLYFFVCATRVIDPVTRDFAVSGIGENSPSDSESVQRATKSIRDSGMTRTENPNLATYALIINFSYEAGGTATLSDNANGNEHTVVDLYNGITRAELYNMVTATSIYSKIINSNVFGLGDLRSGGSYSRSLYFFDESKGNYIYARPTTVSVNDFENFWEFIED